MARILIVDDRSLSRNYLVTLLSNEGHVLLEASDGAAALELLSTEQPDLLISDIVMPTMNGLELARRLHSRPATATTPVVFYSATYTQKQARAMADEAGVQYVLPKPSKDHVVLETVLAALASVNAAPATGPALSGGATPGRLMRLLDTARMGPAGQGLAEYLADLESLDEWITSVREHGRNAEGDLAELQGASEKLARSTSGLQAIGMKLATLVEVGLALSSERDAQRMLELACRTAEDLIPARYVGLGVFDGDGQGLRHFLTAGFVPEPTERTALTASAVGVLGDVIRGRQARRLRGIRGRTEELGLPAGQPAIDSLLAVPIATTSRVYGWLYLADMFGSEEFSEDDERVAMTLAPQVAVAYENLLSISEIREGEERYHILFDENPMPMWAYDPESLEIVTANAAAADQYGYTTSELLRMKLTDVRPAAEAETVSASVKALPPGRAARGTWVHRHKDGRLLQVEVQDSDIVLAGRKVRLAVLHDVTETRNLEDQFRQARKMEAVGRLAGGVAHDFNNLLTVIGGFGELLLESIPVGNPGRPYLEEILAAGDRASSLTRQLLTFSRKEILAPEVVDLNAVVSGMDQMLRRLIGEDLDYVTVLNPDLGSVLADLGQLEQVTMNLVLNARDAMPDGGKITIETANVDLDETFASDRFALKAGPYVLLAVSDTGTGIRPETLEHIFEPFFTTKTSGKGTGLGLATVHGIVHQSGGDVFVYSELGQGTTFKIYLPRVDTPSRPRHQASRAASPIATGTETVLLVEDEEAVRALSRTGLESLGYTVLATTGPAQALEVMAARSAPVHIVVTDVVMPGIGGPELVRRLLAVQPDLAVVFVSGYSDEAILRHGLIKPGTAFLQKPFTPASLARKVREVLDGKSSQAQKGPPTTDA